MANILTQFVRKNTGKNTLTKTNTKQNLLGEPTHLKKNMWQIRQKQPPRGEKQISWNTHSKQNNNNTSRAPRSYQVS